MHMNRFHLILFGIFLGACCTQQGGRMLALEDADAAEWAGTTLKVDVQDTIGVRDLSLYFRYDGTYAGASLPLKIYAQSPDGQWVKDEVTARFGGAENGIQEAVIPWRQEVVFPRAGTYTFNIKGPEVRGIRAVGVIENGER
jgi:hypothetical protein